MHKKNVQECIILEKREVCKSKLIELFMEYGNLITINICNDKIFEGIITFGRWQNSIEDEESWVNKGCQVLLDNNNEEVLYKKAEDIFIKNTIIRTIPVVNKKNRLVANMERYDSSQELEESLLADLWDYIIKLTSEKELNSEIDFLRDIIKRSKYKLIGSNYLAEQFKIIFGLESSIDYNQFVYEETEFDYIIDMDIAYKFVRKHYAERWYHEVYSCDEFLNEIVRDISSRKYTRWKSCLKGEYCNLNELLKLWKSNNIRIGKNRLMTKEYETFLVDHNYQIKYMNKPGFYINGTINGVAVKMKLMPVEDLVYLENQLVKLNLYCKSLHKNIKIFNFDISGNIELNCIERERVKNWEATEEIYTYDQDKLEDFFGSSYNVRDWLKEIQFGSKRWVKGRGFVAGNINSKSFSYYNYIRYTTDVPHMYQNTIYFFGVCTALGVFTKDEDTIESLLQKKINESKQPYRVVNLGNTCPISIEKMIKSINLEKGDIIITILLSATDKTRATIPVIDLTKAFSNDGENHETLFLDMVAHCNARANYRMAEYIFKYLSPFLTISEKRENKEHSLYTVFNNDEDIEWAEKEVEKYISEIDIVKKYPKIVKQNNGAIVMNANPFSKGHLYLVEEASKKCDILFVFVLEEDKSFFSFYDRITMVKKGTEHISNVIVLPSGQFIISSLTFPGYFQKEKCWDEKKQLITGRMDSSVDVRIFVKYIAKALGIKKRFVGDEKFDMITEEYNNALSILLPIYGGGGKIRCNKA